MKLRPSLFLFIFLYLTNVLALKSQSLTQTVRGTVVDQISQSPLPGANVILLNSDPFNGTATDMDGNFKLQNIPVGKQHFKISTSLKPSVSIDKTSGFSIRYASIAISL